MGKNRPKMRLPTLDESASLHFQPHFSEIIGNVMNIRVSSRQLLLGFGLSLLGLSRFHLQAWRVGFRFWSMPKSSTSYPAYLSLAENGELERRAHAAIAALNQCRCCPHQCKVDRMHEETGVCRVGRQARVASYFPHHGEEDCLRGRRGSGTIFFSGCNLLCGFCQNYDLSRAREGRKVTTERLAEMMLELQAAGCHNLNWVTPSHVVPQILEALAIAVPRGLRLPVVYNSGGYDSLETLRWLDGVVDIYMPDFKFWDPAIAGRLTQARDYPSVARSAIREMHRQVGDLVLDERGLARLGLLIRHLVMPHGLSGTRPFAKWLAREISPHTYVNVMAQYHPDGEVLTSATSNRYPDLARPISSAEFQNALAEARSAGLHRFDHRHS
jgi:putative pyruvate formate lyase activating enzyme